MIILLGESASGKTTVQNKLVKNYGYKKLVTYTTRPKRENEVDGIDYHFINNDKFFQMKEQKSFFETACYNGWYYGSPWSNITSKTVAVLTPSGFRQYNKTINVIEDNIIATVSICSVYLDVPRRDRLVKILQRGDNIEEAYRRNLSDVGMFDGIANEVSYIISNPRYNKTPKEIAKEIYNYYECKE